MDADSYSEMMTNGVAQPTIEAIWALHEEQFFEYVPWRGRMSPFWDNKWVSWDISRPEYILAGQPAGSLGYTNEEGSGRLDKVFSFNAQPPGVYSACIANDYDIEGREVKSKMVPLSRMEKIYDNTEMGDSAYAPTVAAQNAFPSKCTGRTKEQTSYRKAVFCNGGYHKDGTAKGSPACDALDAETANLQWCAGSCSSDPAVCQPVTGAARAGKDVKQCQNIASRMIQKKALMHAQAAYWVSIVVVQWADLLICKTRWLSIRQQGLRNSILNFGLFFETLLAAWLCYGGIFEVLGTQPIRFTHWMPGIPWSMMIFMYDETRKPVPPRLAPLWVRPRGGGGAARRRGARTLVGRRVRVASIRAGASVATQVYDARDVARGHGRGHGLHQAPGRLDREGHLLLDAPAPARTAPTPVPSRAGLTIMNKLGGRSPRRAARSDREAYENDP